MTGRTQFLLVTLTCLVAVATGCSKSEKAPVEGEPENAVRQPTVATDGFDPFRDGLLRRKLNSANASADSAKAKTQFSLVLDSGIEFTNTFPRNKNNRLIETGSGVAIGDYDGDGEADVYLLAAEGPNKLYRGLGGFKFEDVTATAGVDGSTLGNDALAAGASFADVDNDGDLDLFVCNMASADLLYINQGDGTFTNEAALRGIGKTGASKVGSFCDYDLDGDLDLYVVTYRDTTDSRTPQTMTIGDRVYIHPDYRNAFGFVDGKIKESGQSDFLFRNDGEGFFTDVTAEAQIIDHAMGLSATWLDYNDDGLPDLYVANDAWQSDRLFQNRGNGTFVDSLPSVTRHMPWFSMGSDQGDLNNDGHVDLMVGEMSPSSHFRQMLNRGNVDESAWFLEFGAPRQTMRNAVYLNSGSGQFMDVGQMTGLSSTNWTWAMRFADLNNDGRLDVFVTNGHARDSMNADIVGNLARLKDQGKIDSLLEARKNVPPLREKNMAFANRGNLEFEDASQKWGLDLEGISHGVAMADLDHDGDLDLVVNNFYEPASVYRNDSQEGNRLTLSLRSPSGNTFGYGAKVELWCGGQLQTKHLSPVRGYLSSDEPVLHFGLGAASTVDRMRITWPGGNVEEFEQLEAGQHYLAIETATQLDTPAKPEQQVANLAFLESETGLKVEFEHQDGKHDDFARQPLLPYHTSRMGPGIALGDINNDGLSDVFTGNGNNRPGSLRVNRGATIFEEIDGPWVKHFLQDDMGVLFFDADGDGDQDLLVTSGGSEYELGHEQLRDRLYLNQQGEVFDYAERSLPRTGVSSSTAAALDFDRDGDLDLIVGSRSIPHKYPIASPTRLLRNERGTFVDVSWKSAKPLATAGIVNSVVCTDFNDDGWPDLVLATEWGPVRFLQNDDGKFHDATERLGVAPFTGWWRGLAAGDFDSDGDLDFVATNQGLNTKYRADSNHPIRLYFGDFDDSGRMDLIESHFEGDTEYPVRGLKSLSNAMPFVGQKFEKFVDFASAPLAEIYDVDGRQSAFKEANYLQSSIFWNDGNSFRVEPLPRMAQTSPGFGVEVLDYDCDGDIDILIANNFFGAQPETGLMDGGLGALLANDGDGKFSFVWPGESGVSLEQDSSGLAVADLDFDGDLDAIVCVHSGKTRTLINQANPESFWKLTISGAKGNSRSIGAQVTVTFGDGKIQRHEVRAGGSYLSQSASEIVVYASDENPISTIRVAWPTGEIVELGKEDLANDGEITIDITDATSGQSDDSAKK
ncbi:FG-GAP-like repeat-containing protein [Mariniblastus fucicola]|uniref:FG-GAP repeat protein n=1 Tax=Mariniblastus fucicola TaxID=980251 RepID=A0A5B9PN11_9BACT|nr:FG-GAP-like repeat-containing protein [Mariniblastus fucicola]QEG23703.1 FG-GAP repeat protein [Mariniblastus fucicola]